MTLQRAHNTGLIALPSGLALSAGALAAARYFGWQLSSHYLYSTVLLVIFAAVISSRIAFQSTKGTPGSQADAARFQTLAEAIPQIVWIADANGHTSYINKRWYEMTGTREGDSLGAGWIESIHPDDREPCQNKWQECMRSGETFEIE